MISKRRKISLAVSALIFFLVISSSFCLQSLTMTVAAAEMSQTQVALHREMVQPKIMLPLVDDGQMSGPCSDGYQSSVPQNTQDVKELDIISRSVPTAGTLDCCLNQGHHPEAVTADQSISQTVLAAGPMAISPETISQSPVFNNTTVFLPPPQAAALRTIIKRE